MLGGCLGLESMTDPSSLVLRDAQEGLCTGCGTCVAVCPAGAVALVETPGGFLSPQVDSERCSRCGICERACPGTHLVKAPVGDPFVGPILEAYVAQATDPDILKAAQSGGLVSALIGPMLDKRLIDKAIVTRPRPAKPTRAEAVRATGRSKVLESLRSYYPTVPVNAAQEAEPAAQQSTSRTTLIWRMSA